MQYPGLMKRRARWYLRVKGTGARAPRTSYHSFRHGFWTACAKPASQTSLPIPSWAGPGAPCARHPGEVRGSLLWPR